MGEIYFARTIWQRSRGVPWNYPLEDGIEKCGGGPVIDLGVHVLDRTLWWCGFPEPEWVMGNIYSKVSGKSFPLEDMGVAMIKMKNGVMIELEASWAANRDNEVIETRLYGTKRGALIRNQISPELKKENFLFFEKEGKVISEEIIVKKDYPALYEEFINSVINDTPPLVTGRQGFMTTQIIDAVYRSAKTGTPVKVENLPEI